MVTRGQPAPQVMPCDRRPDSTDSQADNAGVIPVTSSTLKAQVKRSPASAVDSVLEGPLYSEIVRPG